MHEVNAKSIVSSQLVMNVYRGCKHGCIYCDSRSKCYQMQHDFKDVEVKVNAPERLEQVLQSKKKRAIVSMGSMTDPYQPIEKLYKLTRKCLEVIEKYGFGVTLITKSDLLLRDLPILERIHQKAKCVVQMTLTTMDEQLVKKIEPYAPTTKRRIEVLQVLKEHHIPTVVWLSPFLPYINDTKENFLALLQACLDVGVKGILCFGIGLTLREGNREYFYQQLDEHFPGLSHKYRQTYHRRYEVRSKHHQEYMAILEDFCKAHGIMYQIEDIFAYVKHFDPTSEQLKLFE